MPFASKAQQRFMFAKHPQIAKRWAKEFGVPASLPNHVGGASKSNEIVSPGGDHIPRLPGVKRDFGMLRPSAKARMTISRPASLVESEKEDGVTFVPGSRHRDLGAPRRLHQKHREAIRR